MEYREIFTVFVLSSIICTGCPNRHKIRCIRMYPILHKKLSTCLDIIYTTLTTASVSGKRLRLCVGNSHTRYEAYPSHVGLHRSSNNDKCYLYVHASFPSIHDYWYQGTTSNHTRIYTGILYMFHIATYILLSIFDLCWAMFRSRGTLRQQLRPDHDEIIRLNISTKNYSQLLLFSTYIKLTIDEVTVQK